MTFWPPRLCPLRPRVPNTRVGNEFQEILVWSCLTCCPLISLSELAFILYLPFDIFLLSLPFDIFLLSLPFDISNSGHCAGLALPPKLIVSGNELRCFVLSSEIRFLSFVVFSTVKSISLDSNNLVQHHFFILICLTLSDSICFEIWNIEKMIYRKNKTRWTS